MFLVLITIGLKTFKPLVVYAILSLLLMATMFTLHNLCEYAISNHTLLSAQLNGTIVGYQRPVAEIKVTQMATDVGIIANIHDGGWSSHIHVDAEGAPDRKFAIRLHH